MTRSEMIARLVFALGGRSAEELVFPEPTTGASVGHRAGHQDRPGDGHRVRHERQARRGQVRPGAGRPVPRPLDGPRSRTTRSRSRTRSTRRCARSSRPRTPRHGRCSTPTATCSTRSSSSCWRRRRCSARTWSGSSPRSRSGRGSPRSTSSAVAPRRTSRRSRPPASWPRSAASRGRRSEPETASPTPVGVAARRRRPARRAAARPSRQPPSGDGAGPNGCRRATPTAAQAVPRAGPAAAGARRATARRRDGAGDRAIGPPHEPVAPSAWDQRREPHPPSRPRPARRAASRRRGRTPVRVGPWPLDRRAGRHAVRRRTSRPRRLGPVR